MAVPKGRARQQQQHQTQSAPAANDPYAAWAEYFKQHPEYYETYMKAYGNPATMAAYYNQYYAGGMPNPNAISNSSHFPSHMGNLQDTTPYNNDPTKYVSDEPRRTDRNRSRSPMHDDSPPKGRSRDYDRRKDEHERSYRRDESPRRSNRHQSRSRSRSRSPRRDIRK